MSEFQYYEFQKLDAPLTIREVEAIKKLSSRVQVGGNQAKFIYHFGDFRGDPEKVLALYFDAMIYVANWGTKQLSFRLPIHAISLLELHRYECDDCVIIEKIDDWLIITLSYHNEEGISGWIEEDDISFALSALQGLRKALLARDYRCLYLMWFTQFDPNDSAFDDLPIPAGMYDLSAELTTFAEFFEIAPEVLKRFCKKN